MAVRLVLESDTLEDIDDWCVRRLSLRGFLIELPHGWETLGQLLGRLGVSRQTFHRRMRSRWKPDNIKVKCGPSGRVIMVRSSGLGDSYLQGRRGEKRPEIRGLPRRSGQKSAGGQ